MKTLNKMENFAISGRLVGMQKITMKQSLMSSGNVQNIRFGVDKSKQFSSIGYLCAISYTIHGRAVTCYF